MTGKIIGWVFIVFCGLVFVNYLFNLVGVSLVGRVPGYSLIGSSLSETQLAAVDFGFFGTGGTGRSYITQGYGRTTFAYAYKNDWHNGIDIAATYDAPIYSPGEGIVIASGNQDDYCLHRGFGKYVAVKDGANHLVLWYAHLGKVFVELGDTIKKGTQIGTVGTTGFETGTHLHFSIFDANGFSIGPRNGCGPDAIGRDLNPLSYLGSTYK